MKEFRIEIATIKEELAGTPYSFHREGGWYPLVLASDEDAIINAKHNLGTWKVVNELTGKTVFEVETI